MRKFTSICTEKGDINVQLINNDSMFILIIYIYKVAYPLWKHLISKQQHITGSSAHNLFSQIKPR